jgi:Asp/Glu/hydantoin racemase
MARILTFLHTAQAHVATFEQLASGRDGGVTVRHIVDESLLRDARARGITPELRKRIETRILGAFADTTDLLVCTCSTIGGCAEAVGSEHARPVVRVDRAMAERAVELGHRVLVAATLASTLEPTRELLIEVANAAGKPIELDEVLCEAAWSRFEAGDDAGYAREIARCLAQVADRADVIVLAQASMAAAAEHCSELRTPILSSPRLGVDAAFASLLEPG